MSSSNNRSPIMMNIKDKSPIKKISKAVRRGAHKSSQFYEQVQTRMAEVDNNHHKERHSPSRRHHHSNSSSGDMDSAAYRSRVRDQINRFNSVAVPSSQQSAANDNGSNSNTSTKEHRHHHSQVKTSSRRQHRQQQKSSDNTKYADQANRSNNETHYSEKENESNLPAAAAAAVDTKAASPYSFTSKDGVRVLSPAMHRHKRKSPKKGSSSSSTSPQKATSSSPKKATSSSSPRPIHSSPAPAVAANNSETTGDETEMLKKQLRALEKDNEKLMKRNSRLERKCDKLARDNTQLQAAGKNGGSGSTPNAAYQQDEINSQDNGHSYEMQQEDQSNKRDPDDHPLIGSPLRKHMKLVHESAESNCTVTMRKAPFPLLPPEQTRAIMEERMKEREGEEEDEGPHLGMLGSVTGTPAMEVDANFALSYKKRRGKRTKDGEGGSEEEEAVDLLTSAAFMFKTSRRNLL